MIRKGDILYIHSLDCFGRIKDDILKEWQEITKVIGADIVVLDMPLLDTTKYKDSIGNFISDLILQVLSWLAEDERDRIRTRQPKGIDSALMSGVKFGRHQSKLRMNSFRLMINGSPEKLQQLKQCRNQV